MTKSSPNILVIGDSFLDEYCYCTYRKANPETDGSVYNINKRQYFLGGAAAVAVMCNSLGARATLATHTSCYGEDSRIFTELLFQQRVNNLISGRPSGKTIKKTRYVLNNHLYPDRFDDETIQSFSNNSIYKRIIDEIKRYDIVLISDYGKGMVSDFLLQSLPLNTASILVDPAIGKCWSEYSKCNLIKSNQLEATEALAKMNDGFFISDYARTLSFIHNTDVVVTRGELGIQYATKRESGFIQAIKTEKKDICGAGDTVFSVLGVYLASGYTLKEACEFAVYYAAKQVEDFGVRALNPILEKEYGNQKIRCSTDKS